ncbi:MAG: DUF2141 domain-containing protein [Pseudomonadota bacterium]
MNQPRSILIAIAASLSCNAAIAADLTIEVSDIEALTGALMIAMYDSAAGFDDGEAPPVKAMRVEVDAETVSVPLAELAEGEYAIKLYHDANNNGEMDQNMMGLPIEGYGFSGNGGRFGPPAFEEAVFEVREDTDNKVSIELR